ncbi:MAG TPA: M24 family metallopeptidase [Aggregatilineales bacterium]|nr:M24 family metallopeptidase [Aggregatilineales bacterium]
MSDYSIQREKLAQSVGILSETGVDVWLTFVRETAHNADPALALILGFDVTWSSAFLVTRSGRKIAIVGRYDVVNVQGMGGYDEVIGYDQSIEPALIRILDEIAPRQVAVNYSESDSAADGLSHGMYLTLQRYLQGKPYALVSAGAILNALRGRKTPGEIARLRAAVHLTEQIIDGITAMLKPGLTEREIADRIHAEFARCGVTPSWDPAYCPIVNCGPDSPMGHTEPSSNYVVQSGQIVHVDMGVTLNDYISDMQRLWYVQPAGEASPSIPAPVQKAFDAVWAAIDAAAAVLKPGVQGWQVDAASRQAIVAAGYPEYQHAVGHQVGRTVHDGATLLGPRWERYGAAPEGIVEAGNCFTLELGVHVPGYGVVSLEEEVLVTDHGLDWLTRPQREWMVVKA